MVSDGFFAMRVGDADAGVSENSAGAKPLFWLNPPNGKVQVKGVSGLVDWNLVNVLDRIFLSGQGSTGNG